MVDANGVPVSGAVIYFYNAGTTTPRTVYSDAALTTSLGTSVTCNSAGVPTSNGSTVVEVYTGTTAYKVQIKDSGGTLIPGFSWDNIVGALSTSGFVTTAGLTVAFAAKSADYTILSTEGGTLFEFDSTAASRTATLPSAATVGGTFLVGIRKKVAANSVIIATVLSQTIRYDATTAATSVTLTNHGDHLWLQSDGANWVARDVGIRHLTPPAGTATQAPLQLSSGTNLTTPAAGAMEYDGKALYSSYAASQRGVSPSLQIVSVVTGAKTALSNSLTTAQAIFAAANDVLTVAGSTSYRFRARIVLNTGATSHTTAFGLALTTATLTSMNYTSSATSSAADTLATPQMRRVTSNSDAVLTAASTAVQTEIILDGFFRVNAAGSITPQITFSAGPTGTCEVAEDSYFEYWPIGSNTVAAVANAG